MKILIMIFSFVYSFNGLMAQNTLSDNTCGTKECHESLLKKPIIHEPLNGGCSTCHSQTKGQHPEANGKEFELVESIADLCSTCHTHEVNKKVVHVPFYEEECIACHSPHSSNLTSLLNGNNQGEICKNCHNLEIIGNTFGHGPFMSNQCTSCHVGHQSDIQSLLVKEDPSLCLQCHLEKEDEMDLTNVHPVFKESCLNCHLPHTAKAKNMLKVGDNELCYNCHENVKIETINAKMVHSPVSKTGECVACHTPHAGELNNLLINEQPNLCFNCHSENINNKEKYIDVYARLSKEYVHQPLFENPCTDCHRPHVSDNRNLLAAAFPKNNYTKPDMKNYAMCFQCHDPNKITTKVTKSETNFRDGSKNLHYLHVVKKKSISCQSCHDMHGADNPHIIGNVVYFGNWEMPIGFKITSSGGTCLPGCHVQYSYDREKE